MNLKSHLTVLAGALSCAILLAPTAAGAADDEPGFLVYLQGGGYSPVTDLDDDGAASFDTGYVLGGGIGYRFNRHVALRTSFNYARTDVDLGRSQAGNVDFERLIYDIDLQLRFPTQSGFAPYVFAGGGGITMEPDIEGADSFTKGAGKFGLGFSYDFSNSGVSLFAEGTGWVYGFDRFGYDKTQVDIAWTAGVAYRFGH
jgi:opacity protein-like surface antigen